MLKYYVDQGTFREENEKLIFLGQLVQQRNFFTGELSEVPLYGAVLFPVLFRAGKISFDVSFDDINADTRAGIILNYQNKNGIISFYQIGIWNNAFAYGLHYYNGQTWDTMLCGGVSHIEKDKKYTLSIEIMGNNLLFYVNDIKVFEFSNFINDFSGVCGINISNSACATIENVDIMAKKRQYFVL